MGSEVDTPKTAGDPTGLPQPTKGARWRWSTARRAVVGGGVLAAALGLGSVAAGAATTSTTPSVQGQHGKPPAGEIGQPTAGGKVTAISGDTITIEARGDTSQTVTFSSTTTFKTMSGSSDSAALKVGDFIGVQGTKASNGSVTATSIMFGTNPPGPMGKGGAGKPGGPPPGGAGHQPPSQG